MVTIKDLSSENKVLWEGTIVWPVKDISGVTHTLEVSGFHIPPAEVRLLSAQNLLCLHGGSAGIRLSTSSGLCFHALISSTSNLPELPLSFTPLDPSQFSYSTFGNNSFGFEDTLVNS